MPMKEFDERTALHSDWSINLAAVDVLAGSDSLVKHAAIGQSRSDSPLDYDAVAVTSCPAL